MYSEDKSSRSHDSPSQPVKFGSPSKPLFLLDQKFTNLNHGSWGSIPGLVQDACDAFSREIERNPEVFMREEVYTHTESARASISEMIGAPPETCVFVPNINTALNIILQNFEWSPGDVIVYTDLVFISVLLSIQRIPAKHRDTQISKFTLPFPLSHELILSAFRAHLKEVKTTSNKVVVVFESITALPALLLPWKDMVRICREEKAWSVVDAAHSIGQEMDINLATIDPDFWMTNCSKWFFAKRGCSLLYVPLRNQHLISNVIVPSLVFPGPKGFKPSGFSAQFYWTGSMDPLLSLSIKFAMQFRKEIGGEQKINDYCHALAIEGGKHVAAMLDTSILTSQTCAEEIIANMVNIHLPLPEVESSPEIFEGYMDHMLKAHSVFAPLCHYQGKWWIRASAQIYNDIDDFIRLGVALGSFCQKWNTVNMTEDCATLGERQTTK